MRRLAVIAVAVLAALVSASAAGALTFTYSVDDRGRVDENMQRFREIVASTLADDRGWSLGGSIDWRRVASGGDLRILLADPSVVAGAHPICSREWSCRVGDRVLINERRWEETPPAWPLGLDAYRSYVVNHEVGHWLGLAHRSCPGGGEAPVMQQQSKGLQGCQANVWPLPAERASVAQSYRVEVRDGSDGRPWPVPVPSWFWEWAQWYLHRAEYRDDPFRSDATRPASAPIPIPEWAWRRIQPMIDGDDDGGGGADEDAGVIRDTGAEWPIPVPGWFWEWARWYLHRGEYRDDPFRGEGVRPEAAPRRIPDWAWRRMNVMNGRTLQERARILAVHRAQSRFGAEGTTVSTTLRSDRDDDWILVTGSYERPRDRLFAAWLQLVRDRWVTHYLGSGAQASRPEPPTPVPCDIRPAFAEPRC